MRTLRAALSERLLRYGATVAGDREQMWRRARVAGDRLAPADYQLLGVLDLVGTAALRLGLLLLPSQPPALVEQPATRR